MAQWWYARGNETLGPIEQDALEALLETGDLSPGTLVWAEDMAEWRPASDVAAFQEMPRRGPPPLPSGTPMPQAKAADPARWRRFFARWFDIWWEEVLVVTLVSLVPGLTAARWLQDSQFQALSSFLSFPVILLVDAACYRIFGNTPGKKLLGLRVVTADGNQLRFFAYYLRNLHLWASGLAFGVPVLHILTMGWQFHRLVDGKRASYDQRSGNRVQSHSIGVGTWLAFLGVALLLFAVTVLLLGYHTEFHYYDLSTKPLSV
jgi:uncharacterized RDD family membrane protein YckC